MPSIEVVLLTGRTRRQGVGLEAGKLSQIYHEATTQIRLDPSDLEKLKIEPGDVVEVTTKHGSVVLHAELAERASEGMGFIPYGPWANCVISGDTDSTGMPTMKGLKATVTSTPDKQVLSLQELFDAMRKSMS
ncbi:MAG: molybdopterin dinucleotide binding domain-containing protein [Promethearchaeota archaeon]